jgi:hypothetical protein
MTNYNLHTTQCIKTEHTTLFTNLTKWTWISFAASGFVLTWERQRPPVAPQALKTSTGSTVHPRVAQALLKASTLTTAKTLPAVAF